uniref:Uncharacterized protein n=1 Tax=Octopus bimaculoides TaxID=37653 RepID=A0A0L8IE48_OCTBM
MLSCSSYEMKLTQLDGSTLEKNTIFCRHGIPMP